MGGGRCIISSIFLGLVGSCCFTLDMVIWGVWGGCAGDGVPGVTCLSRPDAWVVLFFSVLLIFGFKMMLEERAL
jgi:hypothetical protein